MIKFDIGIDVDDTICYLINELDRAVAKRYETEEDFKISPVYELEKRYIIKETPIDFKNIIDVSFNDVDWMNLKPIDEAIECVRELQKIGGRLHFITHRNHMFMPDVYKITRSWLSKFFSEFNLMMAQDKMKLCEIIGIKYMIDNDLRVFKNKNSVRPFLFVGGDNKHVASDKVDFAYSNWSDIKTDIIQDIKNKTL